MSFSSIDPSIAPAGKHNLTLWAQWHPYKLKEKTWPEIREQVTESVIAQVEAAAPCFSQTIEQIYAQTPDNIENELALPNANVMHVEMTLDSTFWWRPLPEISRYRMPIKGLYLTGASTHPGGGVFGASGRSTAKAVLADLGLALVNQNRCFANRPFFCGLLGAAPVYLAHLTDHTLGGPFLFTGL